MSFRYTVLRRYRLEMVLISIMAPLTAYFVTSPPSVREKLAPQVAWCIYSNTVEGIGWHMDRWPSHLHGLVSEDEPDYDVNEDVWHKLTKCETFWWTIQHPGTSIFIPNHIRHTTLALSSTQSLMQEYLTPIHLPWMALALSYSMKYYPLTDNRHEKLD